MSQINGILNLFKPIGLTSHDMVGRVRRILHEKRVGHAGTLDPAACGVLPICVGQSTRVVEYLSDARKIYCADFVLGITTDTYDREGLVTAIKDVPDFSLADIEQAAEPLRGSILQIPPIYSAIKVKGQPMYKAARAGTADQIELKPRPVEIYKFEINAWERPWLKVWVECSKGTYIRSLAYDLGQNLGCGAFMHDLIRVQSGPFHLAHAVTLEAVEASFKKGELETEILQPIDSVLTDWPAWIVDDRTAEYIRQGRNFPIVANDDTYPHRRVYTQEGLLLALLERSTADDSWHPNKVFTAS